MKEKRNSSWKIEQRWAGARNRRLACRKTRS